MSAALASVESLLRHPARRAQGLALVRGLGDAALCDALLEGARVRSRGIEPGARWAALPRDVGAALVLEVALGAPPEAAHAAALRAALTRLRLRGRAARLDLRALPALRELIVEQGELPLRPPPELRSLEVGGVPLPEGRLPVLSASPLPKLERLDVLLEARAGARGRRVDLEGLPSLPALRRFELRVADPREVLPALEVARRRPGIPLRGLRALGTGLRTLALGGVRLPRGGTSLLALGCFRALERLSVDRAPELETTEGLGALPLVRLALANAPRLRALDDLPPTLARLTLLDCPEAAPAAEALRHARPGLEIRRLRANLGVGPA